jgi:hypothetical protein
LRLMVSDAITVSTANSLEIRLLLSCIQAC